MKRLISSLLVICMLFPGCVSRNDGAGSTTPSILDSTADEIELGNRIHSQILSSFYVYTEPTVVDYVNSVGKTLAANAKRKELPYRFTTLYNDKIYATSAPGGYVYVTTGLLNFLDNEAELAAVMSHEVQRIQRTDARLSRPKKLIEQITKGGMMVVPFFGQFGALAALGLTLTNMLVGVGTGTQDAEALLLKADKQALHLMVESGYDPQGYIDFLYKFLDAEKSMAPYFLDYYQARPIHERRFKAIELEFQELPIMGKAFSTNRELYQEMMKPIHEIYK